MAMRAPFAVAVLLALVTGVSAQQRIDEGRNISGVVLDAATGAVVADAEVLLVSTADLRNSPLTSHNVLANARTDEDGQFSFASLITRPARVDFPFETSVSVDFEVHRNRQVLNVRRVEIVSSDGPMAGLPEDQGPGPLEKVGVRIYVAAPETAGR